MKNLLFIFIIVATTATAGTKNYGDVTVGELVKIYDGDTIMVNIPEWPAIMGENVSIRVAGVDTPELRTKCKPEKALAKEVRGYVKGILEGAKKIQLKNMHRGKFFRIVADVYVDGKNLSDMLIKNNYGYAYEGGKKQSWCEMIKKASGAI